MVERLRYKRSTGVVLTDGSFTPNGTVVVQHDRDLIVVKRPGYTYTDRSMSGSRYQPAEFVIYRDVDWEKHSNPNHGEPDPNGYVVVNVRVRLRFPVRA